MQRDAKPFAPAQHVIAPRAVVRLRNGAAGDRRHRRHGGDGLAQDARDRVRLRSGRPAARDSTIRSVGDAARNVTVRFANDRSELFTVEGNLEQFVFAAGERMILDEETRNFRYVTVYGSAASVDVVN